MSNGKGSFPRPFSVDPDTYADRWAQTFGTIAKCKTCGDAQCVATCKSRQDIVTPNNLTPDAIPKG